MSTSSQLNSLLRRIRELLEGVDQVIRTIQGNIKLSFSFAVLLFLFGITITMYCYLAASAKDYSDFMKLGPSLILLAVSSIPAKLVLDSRERIMSYRDLKRRCENCAELTIDELKELREDAELAIRELRKRG